MQTQILLQFRLQIPLMTFFCLFEQLPTTFVPKNICEEAAAPDPSVAGAALPGAPRSPPPPRSPPWDSVPPAAARRFRFWRWRRLSWQLAEEKLADLGCGTSCFFFFFRWKTLFFMFFLGHFLFWSFWKKHVTEEQVLWMLCFFLVFSHSSDTTCCNQEGKHHQTKSHESSNSCFAFSLPCHSTRSFSPKLTIN